MVGAAGYSWDIAKREINLAKHGVDFARAAAFEWDTASIEADIRTDYGEVREIAYGLIGGRVYVLVFTRRRAIHIISLRKANRREVRRYVESKG